MKSNNPDLKKVGDKLVSEIPLMGIDELESVIRIAMSSYYKITGELTVTHMPEAEINQAKKEFSKNLAPITVSDFNELKKRTGKTTVDFCEMLGITRQRFYDISKKRDRSEVIKEVPLALLIRLYKKLPSLVSKRAPTPLDVHEAIGGAEKINFQAMAIVFGRGSASSRRWKKGISPSEVSRPVLEALRNSDRKEEILDILIDNVYEEGMIRGLTPFKDMGWNGTPVEGSVEDIPRDFLNAPTVDHRRIEAREGKIVGWGATDPGLITRTRKPRAAAKK